MVALVAGTLWYTHASTKAAAESRAADDSDGVTILLGLADKAFDDNHLVAPIGSNMYEFYLSVLQLDPKNREALERTKRAFEPACAEVESAVSRGDLDEADRELRLLRDFDVNRDSSKANYKLELLGSYLDAQRRILTNKHEMEARLIQERLSAQSASSN
jgi:protein TonB